MRVGLNLCGVTAPADGGSHELPFLNLKKASSVFSPRGNNTGNGYAIEKMNADTNGYPANTTIIGGGSGGDTAFGEFQFRMLGTGQGYWNYATNSWSTTYPTGRYVVLWDGAGAIARVVVSDGTFTNIVTGGATNNRAFVDITTTSDQGIFLRITSLPVTNIRIVYAPDATSAGTGAGWNSTPGVNGTGTAEAALKNGEIFNRLINGVGFPFLDRLRDGTFGTARLMDWLRINDNTMATWAARRLPPYNMWDPVPFEVCVALCNALSWDMWLCTPTCLPDSEIANMRDGIHNGFTDADGVVWAGLNNSLNIYLQWGNEIWNGLFTAPIFNRFQNANRIANSYSINPNMKDDYASFPASIVSDGVGTGTSTMTLPSPPTAGAVHRNDTNGQGSVFDSGSGVADGSYVITQLAGTPGSTGSYTIKNEQNVSLRGLTQGDDFGAMQWQNARRTITDATTFKVTFGSRIKTVYAGQIDGGFSTSFLPMLASDLGGNSGDWVGAMGDNIDAFSTAPYIQPTGIPTTATVNDVFDYLNGVQGGWSPAVTAGISTTTMTVSALTNPPGTTTMLYPGQTILTGAASGTTIVAQLTSTEANNVGGGRGTYQVSISQSVSPGTAMTFTGGQLAQALAFAFADKSIAAQYTADYVSYEGGQHFVGTTAGQRLTFMSTKRDPRMYTIYTNMLNGLAYLGCVNFMQFVDIYPYTGDLNNTASDPNGWGALENVAQPINRSARTPPEWIALLDFMGSGVSSTQILMPQACL